MYCPLYDAKLRLRPAVDKGNFKVGDTVLYQGLEKVIARIDNHVYPFIFKGGGRASLSEIKIFMITEG